MLASPETYSDKNKFLETEAAFHKTADALVNLQKEYEKLFDKEKICIIDIDLS